MDKRRKILAYSLIWLAITIASINLGLEFYFFDIADYDVYQVLEISFRDLVILAFFLIIQYIFFKNVAEHFEVFREHILSVQNGKYHIITAILLVAGLFYLVPSKFAFSSYFLLLISISGFSIFTNRFVKNPFYKVLFALMFLGVVNSAFVFWMHEETNGGRHLAYAQQLAEPIDTIAEKSLQEFIKLEKTLVSEVDEYDFWEKEWMKDDYLFSNYKFSLDTTKYIDTTIFYKPILEISSDKVPVYRVVFPDYCLILKLNTEFRKSVYKPNELYKRLKDLRGFQFTVVNANRTTLSNSHVFDANILNIKLPSIGKGKKIELEGFDVLAYQHSRDVFVLIGEPLSEMQVLTSNFAFLFSLLILIAIFIEVLNVFFQKQEMLAYWLSLPIQHRMQITIIAITCSLFFIIAFTTFVFLHQNNIAISNESKIYIAETLRDEILEEQKQYDWDLTDFSIKQVSDLSEREQCDIDFYNADGQLIVSSYASAQNSLSPKLIDRAIINAVKENSSLIKIERIYDEENKEDYLRTYFGIFRNNTFQGLIAISSFESEIGTVAYIPIVMVKLLNVYVFLLLISWLGSIFLIKLLTRPLQLLANRLSNFELEEENKRLGWKGDDAIGQLIFEYNKMLDKVEITTKKLMRREREDAWQVMSLQIAHEINNKLTPLKLNIQFLKRITDNLEVEDADRIQDITDGLVGKVDMLSKVAGQFKLFAKLDTPNIRPVELEPFIQKFLVNYKKQKDCKYSFEHEELDSSIINIDRQHLEEVITNLLINAEEAVYNTDEGAITVRLKSTQEHIIIEVEDNGEKIGEEAIPSVFDPSFSVTSTETGLGLSITKRIVEFYNGELKFKNIGEIGNSFVVKLPSV